MSIRRGGFQTRPVLFKMRIAVIFHPYPNPLPIGGGFTRQPTIALCA